MMNAEVLAWVVFCGETELRWLRLLLRPGFRHCFVLFCQDGRWVSYDPLAQHTEIFLHQAPADFDLPRWLVERGYHVVAARACRSHKKPAPVMFYTCVEAVKRFLGLHARFVVTPWQLYRRLSSMNQTKKHKKGDPLWAH